MSATASQAYLPNSGAAYTSRFNEVRALSESIASRLSPEDQQVQSMPDVSPTKWHLGHATCFSRPSCFGPTRRATWNSIGNSITSSIPITRRSDRESPLMRAVLAQMGLG